MPRIHQYQDRYMLTDLFCYLQGQMLMQNVTQSCLAHELGITQQALSQKLKNMNLSARELIIVFRVLQVPDEKIKTLLGGNY